MSLWDWHVFNHPWLHPWPTAMQPLVAKYGAESVWTVGMDVLGFPPNWNYPSTDQVLAVKRALERGV